ncbi:hypothetical protein [Phenylobacterium sp.]|uniref:hypothetical protein n=1 Tax=Phenylobacterium sp. TaxID=1871053 RepID=UPI0025DD2589|nr:hypothetical protein [Phenylobacterium sp.]
MKPPSFGAWIFLAGVTVALLADAVHVDDELILGLLGTVGFGWAAMDIGGWIQRCIKVGVWRRPS